MLVYFLQRLMGLIPNGQAKYRKLRSEAHLHRSGSDTEVFFSICTKGTVYFFGNHQKPVLPGR